MKRTHSHATNADSFCCHLLALPRTLLLYICNFLSPLGDKSLHDSEEPFAKCFFPASLKHSGFVSLQSFLLCSIFLYNELNHHAVQQLPSEEEIQLDLDAPPRTFSYTFKLKQTLEHDSAHCLSCTRALCATCHRSDSAGGMACDFCEARLCPDCKLFHQQNPHDFLYSCICCKSAHCCSACLTSAQRADDGFYRCDDCHGCSAGQLLLFSSSEEA
jgi:hypothetical protein